MYVVGVMTDLEYSLRAVAAATDKATFGVTSAQRAARMKQRLHEIQRAGERSAVAAGARRRGDGRAAAGQSAAIMAAADAVGKAALRVRRTGRRQPTGGASIRCCRSRTSTRTRQDRQDDRMHGCKKTDVITAEAIHCQLRHRKFCLHPVILCILSTVVEAQQSCLNWKLPCRGRSVGMSRSAR